MMTSYWLHFSVKSTYHRYKCYSFCATHNQLFISLTSWILQIIH